MNGVRKTDRRGWLIAWALTLALHLCAFLGLRWLPPLEPSSAASREPEPIQLVFTGSRPETRETEKPHFFSELPPDRADASPKSADFLSNVTSRARDLVPGGDETLPRMQGEGDAPTVNLDPDGKPSRPVAAPPDRQMTGFETTSPNSRAPDSPQRAGAVTPQSAPGAAGSSDIHQPEMENPGGNAGLTGEVSLNTTAWDYAPWLQRFGRQLMGAWTAPPAYSLGLLKEGGWAVFELEIAPSGKLLRLDLLEEQGHHSLTVAARGALGSMGSIEPLPADFPEPRLILRLRMIYPKIRPR
ncbi:MAG TPA: hypothetical protein VFQ05_11520 [Candidatus Eisenbacteria bacterium]|nr:hypothetical protein [Candidatus Eisenbacteria bacterium]